MDGNYGQQSRDIPAVNDTRTDWHTANALSSELRMPPLNMLGTPQPPRANPTLPFSSTGNLPDFSRTSLASRAVEPEDNLDHILAEIRDLSITMQALRTSIIEPQEDIWYSDKIYHLQRSLYDVLHQPSAELGILDTPCATLSLVFIGHCLRDIPLSFGVNAKAIGRLKVALETSKACSLEMSPKLKSRLFWMLGIGGAAAEGLAERTWFLNEFRGMSRDVLPDDRASAWQTAKSIYSEMLWHDCLEAPAKIFVLDALSSSPLIFSPLVT